MISNADMRYFTAPIATSFEVSKKDEGKKMYVTQVAHKRNDHLLGTVTEVRKGYTSYYGSRWRITAAGDYVNGHVVNPEAITGLLIGKRAEADTVWMTGNCRSSSSPDYRTIGNTRRSDGGSYTDVLGRTELEPLTFWLPAAPWAVELFPHPADNAATVTAKTRLAKARWELNGAVAHIETEGRTRGWTEDLRELRQESRLDFLPQVTYDLLVTGQALITTEQHASNPRTVDLPEHVQRAVSALGTTSAATAATVSAPVYPVSVVFPVPARIRADDALFANMTDTVRAHFQSRFRSRDYNATLGAYETAPFVGALNTYL